MLLADYKSGVLSITTVKSLPGIVLINRTASQTSAINVSDGVCHRELTMEAQPLSVRWVPVEPEAAKARKNARGQ